MLHYIKGIATMKFDGGVVLEAGGIGYEIHTPENSALYLAKEGTAITAYTAMIVREDDISLYGFGEKDSLALFKKLITVSGVGAKAAMAVLSAMPLSEVKKAIVFEDATSLTRANGIGKKIAQRIVLELKDKMGTIGGGLDGMPSIEQAVNTDEKGEALNALMALGYTKGEAANALSAIEDDTLTVEEYVKKALKQLF
ncbi:MAG: Holliday junction branch migration protein RuvA [Anaerovorax sp.]